ncbi:MAG: hypothetical protein KIT11_11535 [Fimbriimonadaceae bacterium]|nr:hypothetical protein [Fimbriimonadaceae bacterium]QYK55335.1 MAG: hypothetical protein KF733_10000 [Fimbriimonadaceae bacterium]
MNPAGRAFLGALFGALLVLLAHPSSRPFLLPRLSDPEDTFLKSSIDLPENLAKLSAPDTHQEAALWLQVGCERIEAGTLSTDEALLLAEVAQEGVEAEPDNAFWRQMEAVFAARSVGDATSKRAWTLASRAVSWNDHQTERLTRLVSGLAQSSGTKLAWHVALATSVRRSTAAKTVYEYGIDRLHRPGATTLDRYEALRNGVLLREGGRSAASSRFGARLVEAAALGGAKAEPSPKASAKARGDLYKQLADSGKRDEAATAVSAFEANDAWFALVDNETARRTAPDLGLLSMASANLARALLLSGLLGLAVLALGALCQVPAAQVALGFPGAPAIGVVGGALVFWWTGLALPAIWLTVALASLAVFSDRQRVGPMPKLGQLHRLFLGLMAVASIVAVFGAVVSASAPLRALQPWASVPPLLANDPRLSVTGLSITFGLVVFSAAAAGYLGRFVGARYLPQCLGAYGATLAVLGFVGAVVAAPLCVAWDLALTARLERILQNESNDYLFRSSALASDSRQ